MKFPLLLRFVGGFALTGEAAVGDLADFSLDSDPRCLVLPPALVSTAGFGERERSRGICCFEEFDFFVGLCVIVEARGQSSGVRIGFLRNVVFPGVVNDVPTSSRFSAGQQQLQSSRWCSSLNSAKRKARAQWKRSRLYPITHTTRSSARVTHLMISPPKRAAAGVRTRIGIPHAVHVCLSNLGINFATLLALPIQLARADRALTPLVTKSGEAGNTNDSAAVVIGWGRRPLRRAAGTMDPDDFRFTGLETVTSRMRAAGDVAVHASCSYIQGIGRIAARMALGMCPRDRLWSRMVRGRPSLRQSLRAGQRGQAGYTVFYRNRAS